MNFCERFILKDVQGFQKLTAEQKKQYLTLHKHQHLAREGAYLFLGSMIPYRIVLVICVVNFIISICVGGVPSYILFYTTMPLATIIFGIEVIIMYRYKRKKETPEEVWEYLTEKFQNLWLFNCQVISFKDWKNIKRRCKKLYYDARSEVCNHECYATTYAIANILNNSEIKILWIAVQSAEERCGHAIILRNGKIYDSNLRRTFNYDEYFKAFNVEIFKEYSLQDYLAKENLSHESCFLHLEWKAFGEWCREHNVVRST